MNRFIETLYAYPGIAIFPAPGKPNKMPWAMDREATLQTNV